MYVQAVNSVALLLLFSPVSKCAWRASKFAFSKQISAQLVVVRASCECSLESYILCQVELILSLSHSNHSSHSSLLCFRYL